MKEFSILSNFKQIIFTFILLGLAFQDIQAQTVCYETAVLPTDAKWGGADAVGSVLIGNTYGAGQGPGIYIVADGGYRLYLNGELLAYDNAAGRVRFIPMTFLPRKNAISIVGINGLNAPGVLMHLDELEKPYVTGTGWKANNAPADNTWKTKAYNDASWANAAIQTTGSLTQTPSGLAITGFPTTSTAKWIWSNANADKNVVLRYTFDVKAVGFGAATTGGDGGEIVVVSNVTDLLAQIASTTAKTILIKEGSYDLRDYRDQQTCRVECNSTLATYKGDFNDVAGTCPTYYHTIKRWERLIWMSSNKSIIGMGRGASLRAASFYSNGGRPQTNLIFRNLKIWDVNPHIIEANDGISLNAVTKLWVDHCSFKWVSDGNDIADSKECTFSWNRWNGYNEYMCSKRDNYTTMITGSDITFDHDWWDGANGRVPKTYGTTATRIHMINNYHSDNTYYASNSGSPTCLVYIENTHYDGVRFPTVKEHGGVIYCSGNRYDNIGSHSIDWVNSSEPKDAAAKFTVPYAYTLENVNTVKATCTGQAGAGSKWGAMPLYTESAGLSNTAPIVSITSPTNGSAFASTSAIAITASASDAGGSVSKVEFYSGTIKLGEDASAPYTFSLTAVTTCTYSIVAIATDNSGNKTTSWPVTFTVNAKPLKYIYNYDNSGNLAWSNTNSWTPKAVPTAIDTVIIRTGEVQIANLNHTAPFYVETNGILRLIDTSTVSNLRLQGGTLKAYTSAPGMMLTSNITVEQASTIMAGSVAATAFTLNGTITGNANLTKTSVGNLRINSTATGFKGNWIITEGKIQLRSASGLGVCGVQIKSGARLDIEVAGASIYSLVVETGAGVDLDQPLTTNVAVFGTSNILSGAYQNAAYPTFIGSTNTLTVSNSLVSLSGPTAFCTGNNLILTASSGASYIWKNNATQVGTATAYTTAVAGSYTVNTTSAAGCKVSSAPIVTSIATAPTATITTPSNTICNSASVVLTASTGSSYKWFNGTTQVGTAATYTVTAAGSYTVEVTNASGCKATSAATTISGSLQLTPTITAAANAICAGASVVLTSSTGASYKWFNGTIEVGTAATYTATTAGAYTVEVTNTGGCKATSAVTQITVSALPTATITAPSSSFCTGGSVTLTSSTGASYKWFNGATQVGTAATYTATTAGTYTVEVTNASGCKATSAATQITVSTLPTVTITAPITSFCEGGSAVLTASSGSSYKWFNGVTQVGTSISYTATDAGSYTVEVTNTAGCKAISSTTTITETTAPIWYEDADGDGKGDVTSTVTACSMPTGYVATAGDACPTDANKINAGACGCGNIETDTDSDGTPDCTDSDDDNDGTPDTSDCHPLDPTPNATTVWYQDTDGDGTGVASASLTSCTQPDGYVSTAGDACPTDTEKITAGNCGCGNSETSCLDCAGTPHGTAFLDNCTICVGGTTGNTACVTTPTATINGTSANITVVPQPFDASTIITIENYGAIQSYTIISASGALVETRQGLNTTEITLGESIASGLYTVILTTEQGVYTTKIVKR